HDRLHHVTAHSNTPKDRDQRKQRHQHRHQLGPQPFYRPRDHRLAQVRPCDRLPGIALCRHQLGHRVVEINDHDDARFDSKSEQGDETYGNGNGQVNVPYIDRQGATDEGEGDREEAEERLAGRAECEIHRPENDHQHHRQDPDERPFAADQVLVLPAPFDIIALWQNRQHLIQPLLRLPDRPRQVPVPHVEEYRPAQRRILRIDHRRPFRQLYICHRLQRYRPHTRRRYLQPPERRQIIPE